MAVVTNGTDNTYIYTILPSAIGPPGCEEPWTLMAWVKHAYGHPSDWQWHMGIDNSTASDKQIYGVASDGVTTDLWLELVLSETQGSHTLTAGQWYHMAMVRSSDVLITCYLNGEVEITDDTEIDDLDPIYYVMLGKPCTQNTEMWDGEIAAAKMWGVALSQEQIRQEMRTAMPIYRPDILGVWPLDTRSHGKDYGPYGLHMLPACVTNNYAVNWSPQPNNLVFERGYGERLPARLWPYSASMAGLRR